MKKIVIFGGGSGLSQILKGLKLFPLDITAVVTVSDNGTSTGRLRKELHIPAVGDISKVMLAMSNSDSDIIDLMNYRFIKSASLQNHSIKNLLLSALLELKGSFDEALPIMMKLLDIKGSILPLTEDNVDLIAYTEDHQKIVGEAEITKSLKKIAKITYSAPIHINPKVLEAIQSADLILFSSGSLLTSIIPHVIEPIMVETLNKTQAKKMYICNLFTQPGETDQFTVSDHLKLLNQYLGPSSIDAVIANDGCMNKKLIQKYANDEAKDPVYLDEEELKKMNITVLKGQLCCIENNVFRHDPLKVAYHIFSYLMKESSNEKNL